MGRTSRLHEATTKVMNQSAGAALRSSSRPVFGKQAPMLWRSRCIPNV